MTSQEGEFVFIYSENTVINEDKIDQSEDKKMDLILDKLTRLESDIENEEDVNTKTKETQDVSKKSIYIQVGIMVLVISLVMIAMVKR